MTEPAGLAASVRSGVSEWCFVIGRHTLLVLPGDQGDLAGELAGPVDADTPIEQIVSRIPLNGPGAVASFAVLVAGAPDAQAGVDITGVVLGRVAVDVYERGGFRRFTDRGVRPWLISDFRGVTAVVVHGIDDVAVDATEVGNGNAARGAARAGGVDWAAVPLPLPPAGQALVDHGGAAPPEDTVIRLGAFDADTVVSTAEPVHPSHEPAAVTEPTPAVVASYTFRVGDGEEQELEAPVLIGRNPTRSAVPGNAAPTRLVAVASPTLAVSATHLELRREGGAVVVTDVRSTNGSIVVSPRGERTRLRPGQSFVVAPGSAVHIGDDTIVTISAATIPGPTEPPAPVETRSST